MTTPAAYESNQWGRSPLYVLSDGSLVPGVAVVNPDGTVVGGAGGGGGAATVADGADVAEGAKADAAVTNPASSASVIALLKGLLTEALLNPTAVAQSTGNASLATIATAVQAATPAGTNLIGSVTGPFATVTSQTTRPGDANAYAINDAFANSTSAPTAGGFTLTGAARASGGSGLITDLLIVSSNNAATTLQGELYIFDSAVTAVNDNAAFALSAADSLKIVAVVPFTLVAGPSSAIVHLQNLSIGYTCVGTADLRYLVKVKNVYTPANAETLNVRAKFAQVT